LVQGNNRSAVLLNVVRLRREGWTYQQAMEIALSEARLSRVPGKARSNDTPIDSSPNTSTMPAEMDSLDPTRNSAPPSTNESEPPAS